MLSADNREPQPRYEAKDDGSLAAAREAKGLDVRVIAEKVQLKYWKTYAIIVGRRRCSEAEADAIARCLGGRRSRFFILVGYRRPRRTFTSSGSNWGAHDGS